jgi:hypothetical protein
MVRVKPPTNMSAAELLALAAAFDFCADHLELAWTADSVEQLQGHQLANEFRAIVSELEAHAAVPKTT